MRTQEYVLIIVKIVCLNLRQRPASLLSTDNQSYKIFYLIFSVNLTTPNDNILYHIHIQNTFVQTQLFWIWKSLELKQLHMKRH